MSWYENCLKEEIPPEFLWEDSEALEQWWAAVQEKRASGFGGSSSSGSSDDDSMGGEQGPETTENDLARVLKG